MDLGTFQVQRLIVHEVPRRFAGQQTGEPLLSDVPSTLTDDLRNFFKEKITRSLVTAAVEVVRDPNSPSPVPDALADHFARGNRALISVSQTLARHLFASQTGSNSAGLLLLVSGTIDGGICDVVLKLEKEEAVRLERHDARGRRTFDIRHLRDLMLGERTRVFKAGLFPRVGAVAQLRGLVSDNQRGYQREQEVADFFLSRFLGCRLADAPEALTKRFFEVGEKIINESIGSAEARARYELALIAEMNSNAPQVDPRAFVARHVDDADQEGFLGALVDAGAARRFDKSTRLIHTRIRQLTLEFVNGIRVAGSPASFAESVDVTELGDGRTRVNVEGQVKTVKG